MFLGKSTLSNLLCLALTAICLALCSDSFAQESKTYFYYVYPPQDVSDERLKVIIKQWNEGLEEIKEKIVAAKRRQGKTFTNPIPSEILDFIERRNKSNPKWFGSTALWENVDLKGCCIWYDKAHIYNNDNEISVYGLPITYADLLRTKTWREKHMIDMQLVLGNIASRDHYNAKCDSFSFKGWLIETSRFDVYGKDVVCDFSDATLLDVVLYGNDNFRRLRDFVVAKNAEIGKMDSINIRIGNMQLDAPYLPRDWYCDGVFCLNEKTGKIELPVGLTRDQIVTSVLENSLKFDKEVFRGIKARDLYSTAAYRRGDLSNVVFFPEKISGEDYSLKGWNLSNLDLTGSCFDGLDLTDVDFTNSVVTDATFEDVRGLTLAQLKTTWNWKAGRMNDVILPSELERAVVQRLNP